MNIIVDIILALVILIGAIVGLKRGFISTVAKPVKLFACLAIAISLASPVATSVVEPVIGDTLENQISDYMVEKIENEVGGDVRMPTLLKLAAVLMDVDIGEFETSTEYVSSLVDKIASPIIHLVAVAISFILLYFVSKILVGLLLKILNSMFDSGVAGVLNKGLGLVFSTLFAVIIAWASVSLFEFLLSTPMFTDAAWVNEFDGGFIYNFFKNYNPMDLLLSF